MIQTNKAWLICENSEEEKAFYEEILNRVISNPRFYLQNLDESGVLQSYRFSFINYSYKKKKTL